MKEQPELSGWQKRYQKLAETMVLQTEQITAGRIERGMSVDTKVLWKLLHLQGKARKGFMALTEKIGNYPDEQLARTEFLEQMRVFNTAQTLFFTAIDKNKN